MVAIFSLVVVSDYWQSSRRRTIRQQAWNMAMGPPPNWRPQVGERKTLYRTAHSRDLVAEILRATAAKYEQAFGLRVNIREFEINPRGRNDIEGRMTIEFSAEPVG